MGRVWQTGVQNSILMDLALNDVFGASGFETYIKTPSGSIEMDTNITFTELTEDVPEATITTDGDVEAGAKSFKITDAIDVYAGHRYYHADSNTYIYIQSVDKDNNIVTLRRPLRVALSSGTELQRVGNLGTYEAFYTPQENGQYVIIVSNPTIELQSEVTKIEAVSQTISTLSNAVSNDYNSLMNAIDNLTALSGGSSNIVRGRLIV